MKDHTDVKLLVLSKMSFFDDVFHEYCNLDLRAILPRMKVEVPL